MKIVVLAGGRSPERNVSLSSGAMITNALREKGHAAVLIDLFLGDDLHDVKTVDEVFQRDAATTKSLGYAISDEILTDQTINALRKDGTKGLFGKNVLKICRAADMVFLALHGEDGENGKVQAVFDLFDIRYTGSGPLASGVTMDKKISKELLLHNQIKTAGYVAVKQGETTPQLPFDFPAVVKPSNGGSSIGMQIVHNQKELETALPDAFRFDDEVVIEEYIKGREFSLGVVNGIAMPAIEIIVKDGWYDFEHKFQENQTGFQTPPDIPDDVHRKMQAIAVETMSVLGLINYGRIDFFWNDNGIYVIEGNSLPGMTPLSLLPQEAAAAGISYPDLCEQIVQGKLAIYEAK